jgi:hypothetical protein
MKKIILFLRLVFLTDLLKGKIINSLLLGVIIFGSVRFFRAKTGSNRFGSVFLVLARFFRFGSVLARFFRFGSVFFWFFVGFGSVRFFRFFGYKTETETEPNRPVF